MLNLLQKNLTERKWYDEEINYNTEYFLIFLIFKKINDIAENEKENNPKKIVCIVEDN